MSCWQFLIVVSTSSVCGCYEQANCISLNKACKFKTFNLQSIFCVIVVKIFYLTLTEEVFRFACLWLNSSGFADRKHLCMESDLSTFRSWIVRRIFRKVINSLHDRRFMSQAGRTRYFARSATRARKRERLLAMSEIVLALIPDQELNSKRKKLCILKNSVDTWH